MCSTFKLICIMPMISNFAIFLIITIFIFKLFSANKDSFAFSYDSCCLFVNNFFFFLLKLIILLECFLKHSQNIFIQYSLLYTSGLFYMYLNDDIFKAMKNIMEYIHFLLLQIIFQDYFHMHPLFY